MGSAFRALLSLLTRDITCFFPACYSSISLSSMLDVSSLCKILPCGTKSVWRITVFLLPLHIHTYIHTHPHIYAYSYASHTHFATPHTISSQKFPTRNLSSYLRLNLVEAGMEAETSLFFPRGECHWGFGLGWVVSSLQRSLGSGPRMG